MREVPIKAVVFEKTQWRWRRRVSVTKSTKVKIRNYSSDETMKVTTSVV